MTPVPPRFVCAAIAAVALLVGCNGKSEPTLGRSWGPSQDGYGNVRPGRIFNGGDPTGLVEAVRWQSWGGTTATASGFSYFPHASVADSTRERVVVVAFNLGRCRGSLAYRAVEWFFPAQGGTFNSREYIDICTGRYVDGG